MSDTLEEQKWIHAIVTRAEIVDDDALEIQRAVEQYDTSVLKPREFFIDSETIGEGWGFRDIKQEHTRLYLLNKKTHCLCPVHNILEAVTDFFRIPSGDVMQLECGTRRGEAL